MLATKLGRIPSYKIVIAADDAALRFLDQNKDALFPDVPVVFFGINDQRQARTLNDKKAYPGIIESVSMQETMDAIWRLCPDAATVYCVVDSTRSGQGDLVIFNDLRERYPDKSLKILSLAEMSWDALGRRLEALTSKEPLLLLSAYRDKHNIPKSFEDSLAWILFHARSPVFHLWEHGLGEGVAGGKVISHFEQGRLAGLLALSILQGDAVAGPPLIEGDQANKYIFDHTVLKRFGIDPARLPEHSVILNAPYSVWETYGKELVVAILSLIALAGLSILLAVYAFRLRKTRELLQKANQRLNDAQRVAGAGDWEWDLASDTITWSANLYRLFEYDPQQPLPRYQEQLAMFHPESSIRIHRALERAREFGEPYQVELRRTTADGLEQYLLTHGRAQTDENNKTIRLYGSILDITESKLAESKLEASEQHYRQVVDAIQEMLGVIAADGTLRFVNARSLAFFASDQTPQMVVGKNISEFLPPENAARMLDSCQQVIATGRPLSKEVKVALPTGDKWFQNSLTPIRYGENGEECVLSLSLDITENMLLIHHLWQYERALEATSDLTAQIDQDHIYRMANQAYLDWVDMPRGAVIGKPADQVLGEAYQQLLPLIDRSLTGERLHCCTQINHPRKGKRFLEIAYFPVEGADGKRHVTAVIRDITRDKQSSEAVRESEERFRLAFEQTAVGMCLNNLDGKFMRVNEALCNMTGYTEQELLNRTYVDITHPDDLQAVHQDVQSILDGRIDTYTRERRNITKQGEIVFITLTVSVLKDVRGTPRYFVGVVLDITKQKQALEERERHTRHLQEILDATTDGIWEWDLARHTLSFSPRYYTMLGYEPGEFPASPEVWLELVHPEDLESARAKATAWKETMQGVFEDTYRMRTRQGGYRWMESRVKVAEFDADNKPLRLIGSQVDATERRRAEQELGRAHKRLTFHIENSPLAVIDWENGTHIKMWSSQAESIFGWKAEEVAGKNWADFAFVHPEDMNNVQEQLARLFDGRESYNTVINRNYRKDKSIVYCQWYNSLLRDSQGRVVSLLSQVADVTEIKEYEQDLFMAKEQAETASRAKSEFLANMSHEIRTPMNGVIGMLQLIQQTELDEEQLDYVFTATQSAKRLTRLLSDILDLSRIEANRLTLQSISLDLAELVRQVCELFQPAALQAGIDLTCHVDKGIPQDLYGDAARLQQILVNFVGNALKFTKEGSVVVEAYPLPSSTPEAFRVLFSVFDSGVGIPDDRIDTLFKPFSQIGEGYRREYQGAGLGLSICKRLIELMGGSISIASEPGKGTAIYFCVLFQKQSFSLRLDPDASRCLLPATRSLKILLVEDDKVNRISISRLLEKLKYEVVCVEDGAQSLERLRQEEFDLVLMDIQMPVMDGVQATKAIRNGSAGKKAAELPIVAITAYAMEGDKEIFLSAGMDDYLSKPIGMGLLADMLERLCP